MDERTQPAGVAPMPGGRRGPVRALVLLSALFLLLQVTATDYGDGVDHRGDAGFWFLLGAFLLWLVYRRRSRLAWGFVVVSALLGAIVYGMGALSDGRHAFLAATYVGQALPLLAGPVRQHLGRPAARASDATA